MSVTQLAAASALSTGSQVPIRRVALRPIFVWFIRLPSVFILCDGADSFMSVVDYIPRRTASDIGLELFYRNGKRTKNGRQERFILFQKPALHACHYCPSWNCIINLLCALFQGYLHNCDVGVTTENQKLEIFILVQHFTPFKILHNKESHCVSFPEFDSSTIRFNRKINVIRVQNTVQKYSWILCTFIID